MMGSLEQVESCHTEGHTLMFGTQRSMLGQVDDGGDDDDDDDFDDNDGGDDDDDGFGDNDGDGWFAESSTRSWHSEQVDRSALWWAGGGLGYLLE